MTPEKLTRWIEANGYTRVELARTLGIHPTTLAKWCAGLQPIRHPLILALALNYLTAHRKRKNVDISGKER